MSYTLTRLTLKTRLEPRDVSVLTHADAALKLSLYLPFDRSWRESQEGKVLLRDLRRRAAADLERRGALSGGVDAVLSPIDSLLAEPDASRFDGEGLALFSDGEKSTALLLAKAPRASAEIDVAYRLDGILTQIFERDRYYLLHLSQHAIRLWRMRVRSVHVDVGMHVCIPRLAKHFGARNTSNVSVRAQTKVYLFVYPQFC